MDQFEYVIPPEIKADEKALAIYEEQMKVSADAYRQLTDVLQKKHYEDFIALGMDEKTANQKSKKKAIEDARFVLPNACETKIIITMNARSLLNFFRLRCCNRAQWEIRAVAHEMLRSVGAVAPHLFKNAGPSCVNGHCTEGKMSCGKAQEMREFFMELKNEKQG
jgi:thymidylate synthase (FAD)